MSTDLFAVVDPASPRAKFWRNVFLGHSVAIESAEPELIEVEGEVAEILAYFIDFARVSDEVRSRLLKHQSLNWGKTVDELAIELWEHGHPILCGPDVRVGTLDQVPDILASFHGHGAVRIEGGGEPGGVAP